MESSETIFVQTLDLDQRLDKWLYLQYPEFSRTYFQDLIEKECVLVNGSLCKKRYRLALGDEIEICFALTPEIALTPEAIPLDILFEDEDILIINKPAGMVVHPAPGHFQHTFVHALLYHCQNLERTDPLRPGIVHRLDKDTSGALMAAKTARAHRALVSLLSERKIRKTYHTLCLGTPSQTTIDAPIKRHPIKRQEMTVLPDGKPALTKLTIEKKYGEFSYLQVELITGRTHQIRVHLKHIGCPILGDPVYGSAHLNKKLGIARQLLHASSLSFIHPFTSTPLQVQAPLPQDMIDFTQTFSP